MLLGFIYIIWEIWPWLSRDWSRVGFVVMILVSSLLGYALHVSHVVRIRLRANQAISFRTLTDATLQDIHDKIFRNEIVDADGKRFMHCKFFNVTIRYNGTSTSGFSENEFFGTIKLDTNNNSIRGAWTLMGGLTPKGQNGIPLDQNNQPITDIRPLDLATPATKRKPSGP